MTGANSAMSLHFLGLFGESRISSCGRETKFHTKVNPFIILCALLSLYCIV